MEPVYILARQLTGYFGSLLMIQRTPFLFDNEKISLLAVHYIVEKFQIFF